MSLKEFFKELDKDNCNSKCTFTNDEFRKSREIVKIPPPPKERKPKIMLISQDPTVDFMHIYKHTKRYDEETKRLTLFASAIPQNLIVQIGKFCRKYKPSMNIDDLLTLFEYSYWTHLHKCPTEGSNGFSKKCANCWLKKEISAAVDDDTKYILGLGSEVKSWLQKKQIEKWLGKKEFGLKRIYLPHPSGNCRKWNSGKSDDINFIADGVEELIEITSALQ